MYWIVPVALVSLTCALLPLTAQEVAPPTRGKIQRENSQETVQVVLCGKLTLRARLGWPARTTQPVVQAQGRTYVLVGWSTSLWNIAQKLDGKTVAVEGTFTGFHRVVTRCIPDSLLPILHVSSLAAGKGDSMRKTVTLKLQGALEMTTVRSGGRKCEDEPVFRIKVKDRLYGLELPTRLEKQGRNLWGKTVVVIGTLELRRTFAGDVWHVVVVSDLKAAEGDHATTVKK
jgi:hypothetical protein